MKNEEDSDWELFLDLVALANGQFEFSEEIETDYTIKDKFKKYIDQEEINGSKHCR